MASTRERKPSTGAEGEDGEVRKARTGSVSRTKATTNPQPAKPMFASAGAQQRKNSAPGVLPPPVPKKAKPQPPEVHPSTVLKSTKHQPATTTAAPDEESQVQTVIDARYWRTKYMLLEQRAKFKMEREELLAKIESSAGNIAETKATTMNYKNMTDVVTKCHDALELFEVQMPGLLRLSQIEPNLKTKMEHFTEAIQQLLGSILAVDMEVMNMPKTDTERADLMARIDGVNSDLAKLNLSLGSKENGDGQTGQIITAVGFMLNALELFLKALGYMEKNKELMETVQILKEKEEFLKNYLRQMERLKGILH